MADYVKKRTHIINHPRFLEAGAVARDLYDWGMLWSGQLETDGEIPMSALLASPWGAGGRKNVLVAQKLVDVGLWERTDSGYRILRWAEQGNMTKALLSEKRRAERERKAKQRNSSLPPPCPAGTPTGTPDGTPAGSHAESGSSTSTSLSGSGSLGGAGGDDPPAWWVGVLETIAMQGEPIAESGLAWLRYRGHRSTKGLPPRREDALYWLSTVIVTEQRKARGEAARLAERDAKFDADRAAGKTSTFRPPDTPPAPYHQVSRIPKHERQSDPKQAAGAIADVLRALEPKREAS
jgi:hypothetical protein